MRIHCCQGEGHSYGIVLICCQEPACRPHTYFCSSEQIVVHKVVLAGSAVDQARMVAAVAEAGMKAVASDETAACSAEGRTVCSDKRRPVCSAEGGAAAYSAQGMTASEAGLTGAAGKA